MPTIVGILTLYDHDKYNIWKTYSKKTLHVSVFNFYELLKLHAQLS